MSFVPMLNVSFFDSHQTSVMHQILYRSIHSKEQNDNRIVKLDAPGGFGKTHMLRELCKLFVLSNIGFRVATFTGRAASQVAKDGLTNVSTLHSLLYDPVVDDEGNLLKFEKKLDQQVAADIGDVLICDEASMVPSEMFYHMKGICDRYQILFVLVGDRMQLPSIEPKSTKGFDLLRMENLPLDSHGLVTNYRQKEGSAIADLCMHLREINSIPRKKADDLSSVLKSKVMKLDYHLENQFDTIICGTHAVRHKMNALVRRARGFAGEIPQRGETIICKRNDMVNNTRINNGELFVIEEMFPSRVIGCHQFMIRSLDSDLKTARVDVPDPCWEGDLTCGRKIGGTNVHQFEFGYSITCHSAQGSQFDKMLYIDQDVSFFLDQQRFRYTACSRARNHLTVAI